MIKEIEKKQNCDYPGCKHISETTHQLDLTNEEHANVINTVHKNRIWMFFRIN